MKYRPTYRTEIDPSTPAAARPRPRGNRSRLALGGMVLMVGLVAAACGSSTSSSSSPSASGTSAGGTSASGTSASAATTSPSTNSQASSMGTIHTASVASVGTVLVDSSGRTLYLFTPDKQKSVTCTGACAKIWPPLFVHGSAVAGSGTKSSLLGTIKAGGKTVVTYNHWPLYTFAGDKAAGQAKGEGVLKTWFAVTASGSEVKAATTTPPTTAKKGSKSGGSVGY